MNDNGNGNDNNNVNNNKQLFFPAHNLSHELNNKKGDCCQL